MAVAQRHKACCTLTLVLLLLVDTLSRLQKFCDGHTGEKQNFLRRGSSDRCRRSTAGLLRRPCRTWCSQWPKQPWHQWQAKVVRDLDWVQSWQGDSCLSVLASLRAIGHKMTSYAGSGPSQGWGQSYVGCSFSSVFYEGGIVGIVTMPPGVGTGGASYSPLHTIRDGDQGDSLDGWQSSQLSTPLSSQSELCFAKLTS